MHNVCIFTFIKINLKCTIFFLSTLLSLLKQVEWNTHGNGTHLFFMICVLTPPCLVCICRIFIEWVFDGKMIWRLSLYWKWMDGWIGGWACWFQFLQDKTFGNLFQFTVGSPSVKSRKRFTDLLRWFSLQFLLLTFFCLKCAIESLSDFACMLVKYHCIVDFLEPKN